MSIDWQYDTILFHRKCGVPIGTTPALIAPDRVALRLRLLQEELDELKDAYECGDIVEIGDGYGDLIYIACGGATEHGIYLPDVWDEIQDSNMTKDGDNKRGDGKVTKGPNFVPPDIALMLREQDPLWQRFGLPEPTTEEV